MSHNLRRDAEELSRLSEMTKSENVRRILTTERDKMLKLAEDEEKLPSVRTPGAAKPTIYTTKIINYAWDQSDKYLKIYVTLPGVHTFPSENVTSNFSNKEIELQAQGPDKKNHMLQIKNLLHEILPSESYSKVKTDMVVLYLRKTSTQHWAFVTETEKKSKEPKTPKFEKDEADPGQSLMSMMKQMYDEGDDEMKRTIAKAWTDARENKTDKMM